MDRLPGDPISDIELTDYKLLNRIDRIRDRVLRSPNVSDDTLMDVLQATDVLKRQIVVLSEQQSVSWAGLLDVLEHTISRNRQLDDEAGNYLGELVASFLDTSALMAAGHDRFEAIVNERGIRLPPHGSWEIAAILAGSASHQHPIDEDFLNLMNEANPRYTGWPLWIYSRGFVNEEGKPDFEAWPYSHQDGYEAFIFGRGGGTRNALDFWRAEPVGRFYLYRALQEDLAEGPRSPKPLTILDPVLAILRTAEAIGVQMAYAEAMDMTPDETTLLFEFRWSGLEGRELDSWVSPDRFISPGYRARQDEVESRIAVPLEVPTSAIASFVRSATGPLFDNFGGWAPGSGVIEDFTNRVLSRRL